MSWSLSSVEDYSCPCPKDGYYDVFISFRGIDTRSGFTDTLYRSLLENKIYTFIDADLAGSVIETLFEIIGRSKMAVVVYSEKFASSHWCLTELEMIMRRWEEKKMLMIPIFYKIDAHELKHPTEKTTKYFDEHIIKYGETIVRKWKDTVIKIGNVSGFPYKDVYSRSERDFIKQVIATIKKKLKGWGEIGQESSSSILYNNNSGPGETENHDVFISFLGKDTRYDLVNHLYGALMNYRKDIKIFMVDRDILKDDSIFEAIQRSKIAVIVFSPNYASSKWCLKELVKILQCTNTTEILPIFYEIAPSDLINQEAKGSRLAYHLEKHVHDEESDTIQSWRDAITDLGYIIGWRYSAGHSTTELTKFIRELVEDISMSLNRVEDETKESTKNQQAHASDEEENTQAFALQNYDGISPVPPAPLEHESEKKPLFIKSWVNQDLLIKCISKKLGFSGGTPVAACVIYKCLIHWRSFEVERTGIFDRIIQTIDRSIFEVEDKTDVLAYWLCNASTLLSFLQHTFKGDTLPWLGETRWGLSDEMRPNERDRAATQRRRSIFARILSKVPKSSPGGPGLPFPSDGWVHKSDELELVEVKYLQFKQQLTTIFWKMYGMIRDNLKKDIFQLLMLCIQAPIISPDILVMGGNQANSAAQLAKAAHWTSIVKSLENYLTIMKANMVPPFLVREVFTQIFILINVELFNSVLLRREGCSFSNGEYVRFGLSELKMWCRGATEEYVGSSWGELRHIRQAVEFLVLDQKSNTTLNEITEDLCSMLNIQQLYRISTLYWDDNDKYRTHGVSGEVITRMRLMLREDSNNDVITPFLLDYYPSIRFSVDDISKAMQQVDINEVEAPSLMRENSEFSFLLPRSE